MGVVGAGTTTVGRLVAARLDVPFVEADDSHSPDAIAAMRAGRPLDDAPRGPGCSASSGP
jgi:gluconokinase